MISKEHRKHTKLARPGLGNFAKNEFAFVGAPCGQIQQLAHQIIAHFHDRYACAYADARHLAEGDAGALPGMLSAGATIEYTETGDCHQLHTAEKWGMHQFRQVFQAMDLVLVNGNHHEAAAQVVMLDPAKKDSLRRRLGQLTNVKLLILPDESMPVFDFLVEAMPEIDRIPRLMLRNVEGIFQFFEQQLIENQPLVNGLVLAGGKSVRMGHDKSAINWHGKPQWNYLADLMAPFCQDVFISCREDQRDFFQHSHATLSDTFLDLGPYGALLSAFRSQPERAWLVVACDLPLLDAEALSYLLQARSPKHLATAYKSPGDGMPEPLIAIWEPKSYPALLSFLSQGYSCPRKVLLNSDAKLLEALHPEALLNVNTPEEFEVMQAKLRRYE